MEQEQPVSGQDKSNIQYCYDASADWEDEEYEQEEQNNTVESVEEPVTSADAQYADYETYNNGVDDEVIDSDERIDDSRMQDNYEQSISQEGSVDEDNVQQEIVQNTENNLVYTVLGSVKQAKSQDKRDVEFVEVCSFLFARFELPFPNSCIQLL